MESFETYESEELTAVCDTALEAYYTSEPDVVWVGPAPTWMPPWRSPRRVN